MRLIDTFLCLYTLALYTHAYDSRQDARPRPRSIDAVLLDPEPPDTNHSPHGSLIQTLNEHISKTPFLKHIDLRSTIPNLSYIKRLDIRQQAGAGTAAGANAGANAGTGAGTNAGTAQQAAGGGTVQQPAAGVQQPGGAAKPATGGTTDDDTALDAEAQEPAAPAPVAPVAGGVQAPAPAAGPVAGAGGGAAPGAIQPGAGAKANPVTVINVETVVGGVTKTVPKTYTQSFGPGQSAPPVKTGTIGLGTLTGEVGVVRTGQAKGGDGSSIKDQQSVRWHILGVMGLWTVAMAMGGIFCRVGIL